jgi:hypothetical protein
MDKDPYPDDERVVVFQIKQTLSSLMNVFQNYENKNELFKQGVEAVRIKRHESVNNLKS